MLTVEAEVEGHWPAFSVAASEQEAKLLSPLPLVKLDVVSS